MHARMRRSILHHRMQLPVQVKNGLLLPKAPLCPSMTAQRMCVLRMAMRRVSSVSCRGSTACFAVMFMKKHAMHLHQMPFVRIEFP